MISTSNDFASALFMLAMENDKLNDFSAELKKVKTAFEENPEYFLLLNSPDMPKHQRIELIENAFSGEVDEYVVNFLKVLCDHHKLNSLNDCIKIFNMFKKQTENRVTAYVKSAVPLSYEQEEKLREKLQAKLGSNITIKSIVDKTMLGGIKIEFEDKIIDGSIRKQLHDIKDVILG